jgi:hypothetical protein
MVHATTNTVRRHSAWSVAGQVAPSDPDICLVSTLFAAAVSGGGGTATFEGAALLRPPPRPSPLLHRVCRASLVFIYLWRWLVVWEQEGFIRRR